MRLLADEHIGRGLLARLRGAGHAVLAVGETAPGAPDAHVLALAREQGVVLLTEDTDFGELVLRAGRPTSGVILLRLGGLSRGAAAERVVAALARLEVERIGLAGAVATVEPARVRVRMAPGLARS